MVAAATEEQRNGPKKVQDVDVRYAGVEEGFYLAYELELSDLAAMTESLQMKTPIRVLLAFPGGVPVHAIWIEGVS